MKVKKVEISAFRAFNKKEDSTFDFTLDDGQTPADFISIYAPNGFGKTSFYDAVEWCLTNKIERFSRLGIENEKHTKDERKVNNVKNELFLINKQGENSLEKFVSVSTDIKSFRREIPNSKYDFRNSGENAYFSDVILAQDTIDAFLKEENPDERYKKFVESFPELNRLNETLQNIKILIDVNEKELKSHKKSKTELEKVQLKIDFDGDNKILLEVNNAISKLKSLGEDITEIEKDAFTQKELDILATKIISRTTSLSFEVESIKRKIDNIDFAYNGNNLELKGIVEYYNLKNKKNDFEKRINELKAIKGYFEKQITLNNQLKEVEANLKNTILSKEKIKPILNSYEKYNFVLKLINENQLTIENYIKDKKSAEKLIKDTQQSEIDTKGDLNLWISDLGKINLKLSEIPIYEENIVKITKTIDELKINLNKNETEIKINESKSLEFQLEVNRLNFYKEKLNNDLDLLLTESVFLSHKVLIENVIKKQRDKENLIIELEKISKIIDEQHSFNIELKDFISKGLAIVHNRESNVCPLCTQTYDSYLTLSEKLLNNDLIDKNIQIVLNEKSKIDFDLNSLSKSISKDLEFLDKIINEWIFEINKTKRIYDTEALKLKDSAKIQINELKKLDSEKIVFLSFFEGLDINSFKENRLFNQKNIQTKIVSLNKELEEQTKILNENVQKVKDIDSKIFALNETNKQNILDSNYKTVIDFFQSNYNSSDISLNFLEGEAKKCENLIKETESKKISLNKELEESNLKLSEIKLNEEEVNATYELIIKTKDLNEKIISNFEQLIYSDYKIDLKIITKDEADIKFTELKDEQRKILENKNTTLKEYEIVNNLKNDTFKLLEFEKTKNRIEEIKTLVKSHIKLNENLISEKENLEVFLKSKIDSFFYKNLINQIYFKIEPHPDYRKIDFDCDFSEHKPRLQIYTVDSNGIKSIPALYFSTAQINILSLSVFLARALHAKDDDKNPINCIFIDDPIQSMDSINILSFIDLFRSIVVNFGKQLVISTHEENFFNLLQKKIPEKLFNSKFIQFETFGKLEKTSV